jgi:hypothetical protein
VKRLAFVAGLILQDKSITAIKWGLSKKTKKSTSGSGDGVPTIDDEEYDEVEVVEQVSETAESKGGRSMCARESKV